MDLGMFLQVFFSIAFNVTDYKDTKICKEIMCSVFFRIRDLFFKSKK